jgi:hypothetical protein
MLPGFGAGYIEQHDCATRRETIFAVKNNLCDTLMAKIGSPEQREEYF